MADQQELLREAWIGGKDGCMRAQVEAKAWALRARAKCAANFPRQANIKQNPDLSESDRSGFCLMFAFWLASGGSLRLWSYAQGRRGEGGRAGESAPLSPARGGGAVRTRERGPPFGIGRFLQCCVDVSVCVPGPRASTPLAPSPFIFLKPQTG